MGLRRAIIPFHFGIPLDIFPSREGEWNLVTVPALSRRLQLVSEWKPNLVVSGDCMASIAAHRNGLPLVWFDAHGDFHTLSSTITGSLGGMPLAMLRGLGDQTLKTVCRVNSVSDITHVGGTEFDPGELECMRSHGVVVKGSLDGVSIPSDIHLHVDTDVISSMDMPSSFHPAPNGMPLQRFWECMEAILSSARVLSIKAHDPRKDVGGQGNAILTELIRGFENEHR